MDYEDIFDEQNETFNATDFIYHHEATISEIVLESVKFLVCVLGTSIDVLIIYIILKYKNMQKPVNIYIMNWLICDALFILVDPAEYRLYTILIGLSSSDVVLCNMMRGIMVVRTLDMLFMVVIMFHWFFDKTKIVFFDTQCYKVVAGVWILGLVELIVSTVDCSTEIVYSSFAEYILAFLMLLFSICLIVIHCMRRCANPFTSTSSLPIALITSFVLLWMSVIVIALCYHAISRQVFFVVFYVWQVLIYSYPAIMFYLFYKIDPKFAICVRILFRITTAEDVNTCFEEMEEDNDEDVVVNPAQA